MRENTDYRLMQIIESILESSEDELKKRPVDYAKLVTFAEVLKIIQEQLSEEERIRFKLDFDIDNRYM